MVGMVEGRDYNTKVSQRHNYGVLRGKKMQSVKDWNRIMKKEMLFIININTLHNASIQRLF